MAHLFQVGLDWHAVDIYYSAISAFLEPHHLHKASNHPVVSKLMHHFYLQHPLSHKHFDPWDVEHLLESWAPVSSLTDFKLAWKTATLLALVTAKHCSDLTVLCIDNQHLFLSVMLLFSFLYLVARCIDHVIFLLRIILSVIPLLIFVLFLYLKAYLSLTGPFRKKPDGSHVTSLFLDNNRQHRPVCAKTISSWVRKILCC